MSEDAAERRKRLHALREKATSDKNKGRGGGGGGGAPTLKFRNYRPQDPSIDEKNGKSATTSTAVSTKASSKEEGRGAGDQVDCKCVRRYLSFRPYPPNHPATCSTWSSNLVCNQGMNPRYGRERARADRHG